ncbi:hypothetical protein SLEP1_g51819 [Rubroshorea leprosula]|uniref:Uncharacterized protein n=1 Tax=Rubroshorea leprosula TaxID=152421 RepID=A0AAV5M5F2_9ROSI|nr:hypothetical protein SLEP1_g51819 [Rubroshorea leprosula]
MAVVCRRQGRSRGTGIAECRRYGAGQGGLSAGSVQASSRGSAAGGAEQDRCSKRLAQSKGITGLGAEKGAGAQAQHVAVGDLQRRVGAGEGGQQASKLRRVQGWFGCVEEQGKVRVCKRAWSRA